MTAFTALDYTKSLKETIMWIRRNIQNVIYVVNSRVYLRMEWSESRVCVCVCRLGKELDDLKKRRAAVRASLKTQVPETARAVQSGE